jgi:hypothetical protein
MSNNRDDFTDKTKDRLAKRVGYRCSNPGCRRPTCGASQKPDGYVSIGVAAHILAAASGGKRYDKSMSTRERKSILNGIWLCQSCSKLIDSDELRYPKELLYQWKHDAEAEAIWDLERYSTRDVDLSEAYDEIKRKRNYEAFMDFLSALNREVDQLLLRMEEIREKMEAAEMEDDRMWFDIYERRFNSLLGMYNRMNEQIRSLIEEGRRTECQLRDLNACAESSAVLSSFGHSSKAFYCEESVEVKIDSRISMLLPEIRAMHAQLNHFAEEVKGLHMQRIEIEKFVTGAAPIFVREK